VPAGFGVHTRKAERFREKRILARDRVSAAVLEARQRFRRIRGYKDMDRLIAALEPIEQEQQTVTDQQVA
jgi:hypothetical protein